MSERMPERLPESSRVIKVWLPGTITEIDLALQGEYDGGLLRADAFNNPALRHEPTEDERQKAENTSDNIWQG